LAQARLLRNVEVVEPAAVPLEAEALE